MQIIKNNAVISLTVDEFIDLLENDLLDDIIATLITLDRGIDMLDADGLESIKDLVELDDDDDEELSREQLLLKDWLEEAKKILNEYDYDVVDFDETEDDKVERLYDSLIDPFGM